MPASTVVDEIQTAVATLRERGIDAPATLIDAHHGERIYKEALAIFVEGGDRRWWWEAFKLPFSARQFENGDAWKKLSEIVPDASEPVWLIAEEDSLPFYPVFEATPRSACQIIGECYAFEYYLVAKDLSWLVCESHHNTLYAVGDEVARRLSRVST